VTDPDPAAFAKAAASKGMVVITDWDHDHAMQVVRENRRRYAHTRTGQLLDELAAWMAEQPLVEGIGLPEDQIARVLVRVAAQLGTVAFTARQEGTELRSDHLCNVLGYVADDLSRDHERRRADRPEQTITPHMAAHVLHHYGAGGYEPGSFIKGLIAVIARADLVNRERMALGFPGYVAGVNLADRTPNGIEILGKCAAQEARDG
jgi:hypothetical protein